MNVSALSIFILFVNLARNIAISPQYGRTTNLQPRNNRIEPRNRNRPINGAPQRSNQASSSSLNNRRFEQERPGAYYSNGVVPRNPELTQVTEVPEVIATEIPHAVAEPLSIMYQIYELIFRRAPVKEVEANSDGNRFFTVQTLDINENTPPIQAEDVRLFGLY